MDADNLELATGLISATYVRQGGDSIQQRQRLVKTLLSQRRLPTDGWPASVIDAFVRDCSAMDSNNFSGNAGVGEREARIACPLVQERCLGLAHGIGRSGDVMAEQPKAAGSSLLVKVVCILALDALRSAGMKEVESVTVLPAATGVALLFVFLALRQRKPGADTVIWSRIDQKTCIKSIASAGLTVHVVEPVLEGDQLITDMGAIESAMDQLGHDRVLCVVTTTSCFAPRGCDRVIEVAKLCKRRGMMHVVNNAYGVQDRFICEQLSSAARKGVITASVQSTDKNFMVPVGGAVVADFMGQSGLVREVNALWPGRAGITPILDLLMTLLHWGRSGWDCIRAQRQAMFEYLGDRLQALAEHLGERVLLTPRNHISIALTLDVLQQSRATMLGSRLFLRRVSGARVVVGKTTSVGGVTLHQFGVHSSAYPHVYLTAAAGLGATEQDIDLFIERLGREYEKLRLADTAAQVVQRGPGCGGGMEDRESIAETGGVDASELLQDADDGVALGLNTVE